MSINLHILTNYRLIYYVPLLSDLRGFIQLCYMEGSWRQEVSIPSYKCFRALLNSLSVPEGKVLLISLTAEAKIKRGGTTMTRHVPGQ